MSMRTPFTALRPSKNLLSRFSKSNRKKASARRSALAPEQLEDRVLLAADTVIFDPDPADPDNPTVEFAALDFVQGTSFVEDWDVLINNMTAAGDEPTHFSNVLYQTRLNSFADEFGNPIAVPELNSDFEITVTAEFVVYMAEPVDAISPPTLELADPALQTGSGISLYLSAVNSVPLSPDAGTAALFADGVLLLHADVTSYFSAFTYLPPFDLVPLDDFTGDDWSPTVTLQGSGGQAIEGVTDLVNPFGAYLIDPNTDAPLTEKSLELFSANGNSELNYEETNPSKFFWNGTHAEVAVGAVNADGTEGDGADGAVFQADANASLDYARVDIHGFKYEDWNKDGVYNPDDGDVPFEGIEIQLWNDFNRSGTIDAGDTLEQTVYTHANGEYWFQDVCSGYFVVREVLTDPDVMPSTHTEVALKVEAGYAYVYEQGSVVGRHVFYNSSAWDGDGSALSAADDDAIATDKSAYVGTGAAGYSNYTDYTRGINGIMIDIQNGGTLSLADFEFRVGNDNDPSSWVAAPAPSDFDVRPGDGDFGSDRYSIAWDDGAITNQWLQVVVLVNENTNLGWEDIHYWGNQIGEVNNGLGMGVVDGTDAAAVTNNQTDFGAETDIEDPYDVDRNKVVDGSDRAFVVNNRTPFLDPGIYYLEDPTQQDMEHSCDILNEGLIFGNFVKGSIHGFKFNDYEADGIYTPSPTGWDLPFGGIGFELYMDNGNMVFDPADDSNPQGDVLVDTQLTDEFGRFWFEDLMPADYFVLELPSWDQVMPSTPMLSGKIELRSGQEIVWQPGESTIMGPLGQYQEEVYRGPEGGYDENLVFGNFIKGSIHGFKFEDYDADGIYEPLTEPELESAPAPPPVGLGDAPVAGMEFGVWQEVTLESGEVVFELLDRQFTDDDGQFWFLNLRPGTYFVGEIFGDEPGQLGPLNEYMPSPGLDPKTLVEVYVGSGEELAWTEGAAMLPPGSPKHEIVTTELAFGNYIKGSIHGFKCEDLNADGECGFANQELDVVFIVDTSGSFGDDVAAFQAQAGALLTAIDAIGDTQFGLVTFEDFPISPFGSSGDLPFEPNLLPLDSNIANVQTAINSVVIGSGNDGPESQYAALWGALGNSLDGNSDGDLADATDFAAAPTGFRANSTKVFILWTDAGFHDADTEGSYPNDTFQSGAPGKTEVTNALVNMFPSGPVKVIGITSGGGGMTELTDLANATGAVDTAGDPLVFDIGADLMQLSDAVLEGLDAAINADPPFPNVPITIVGPSYPLGFTTFTNEDGEYWFENLIPGVYTVFENDADLADAFPLDNVMQSGRNVFQVFVGSREEYVWREGAGHFDGLCFPNTPGLIDGSAGPADVEHQLCQGEMATHTVTFEVAPEPDAYNVDAISVTTAPGRGMYVAGSYPVSPSGGTGTGLGVTLDVSVVEGDVTGFTKTADPATGSLAPDDVYTGITPTGGSGSGFTVDITVSGGVITDITQTSGGAGYVATEVLSVSGALFGGVDPVDNIELTVDSVGYTATVTVGSIDAAGTGYLDGDVVSVPGEALGGLDDGTHDVTLTVDAVGNKTIDAELVLTDDDYDQVESITPIADSFDSRTGGTAEFDVKLTSAGLTDAFKFEAKITDGDGNVSGSGNLSIDGAEKDADIDIAIYDGTLKREILVEEEQLVFANYVKGSIHALKFHDADVDGVYDPAVDGPFKGVVFDLFDSAGNNYRQVDTGFEDGTFPDGFSTSSTDPDGTPDPDDLWSVTSTGALDGTYSATSGDLNANETSTLETDVDGWGIIRFDWAVSSESFFDFFRFKIDGSTVLSESGTNSGTSWFRVEGAGSHNLQWVYSKDGSVNVGADRAWIDNVTFYTTSDDNGELWWVNLIPDDYVVAEYPDAFIRNFPGEVMSSTHEGDSIIDPVLGPAIVQRINVQSGVEKVWGDGAAHLPQESIREEMQTDDLRFGNFIKGSIHGFKFEDLDADGIYEPGGGAWADRPWSGFEFTLYEDQNGDGVVDEEDAVVSNALTDGTEVSDGNGEFWFLGLVPGWYILAETGEFNDDPLGEIMPSTPIQRSVFVGSGEELVWRDGAANLNPVTTPMPKHEVLIDDDGSGWNENLMFGNYVKGSIHGFKFEDLDGDGAYEPDDPLHPESFMAEIPFEVVRVDPVTGEKTDVDGDGNPDWITHDEAGNRIKSDHAGEFWIENLVPGDYFIRENLTGLWPDLMPSDMLDAAPEMGRLITVHSRHELVWTEGDAHIPEGSLRFEENVGDALEFGNYIKGSIHGFKCIDVDADGVCETTGHVEVIVDASQTMTSLVADGTYGDVDGDGTADTKLDGVVKGLLELNSALEAINAGLEDTNQIHLGIVVMAGGGAFTHLPFTLPGAGAVGAILSIDDVGGGDTNFEDGIGLAAANLAAWDTDGSGEAHTNNALFISDGHVNAGDDYADDVAALAAQATNIVGIAVGDDAILANVAVVDPDAVRVTDGDISPTISGTAAGINLPEPPHAGVDFDVYRNGVLVDTVTTVANGEFWAIDLVPGFYDVVEQVPAGWESSTGPVWSGYVLSRQEIYWSLAGVEDNPIKSENLDTSLIFGNYQPVTIHVDKFNDLDADGANDGVPMPGIGFWLLDASGSPIDYAETNLLGQIWFPSEGTLPPGTYTVLEHDDPDDDIIPTTPTSQTVTLYTNEEAHFEFGNTILGSIHGFKYHDLNADGFYDADGPDNDLDTLDDNDTPWAGFDFEIVNSDGVVVDVATSGDDGQFWSTGLWPDVYTIREVDDPSDNVHPSTFSEVVLQVHSGEELVWRDDAANLQSHDPQHEVFVGGALMFGNWIEGSIHGCVFHDDNLSGIYEAGADSIQGGVDVELYDSGGNLVGSITTVGSGPNLGLFWFEGLRPDEYTLVIPDVQDGLAVAPSDVDYDGVDYAHVVVLSGREYVHQDGAAHLEANQVEVNLTGVPAGTDRLNLGVLIGPQPAAIPVEFAMNENVEVVGVADKTQQRLDVALDGQIREFDRIIQLNDQAFESLDKEDAYRPVVEEVAKEDTDFFAELAEDLVRRRA